MESRRLQARQHRGGGDVFRWAVWHAQDAQQSAQYPDGTTKGTPLSPKNLYNRALAPTCDRLGLHRISRHLFRHANATLLGEVGESLKTAQAILGHSDLETTLNTYIHVIPDSQRLAVERVAAVLFPDVPKNGPASKEGGVIN